MAGALYGLVLVAFIALTQLLPQPAGWMVFWGINAIQLARGAVICWRRTGLPFLTAAIANGAAISLCMLVVSLLGEPYPNLRPTSWVFFGGNAALGLLFLWIESRVNRATWRHLKEHGERTTLWDIVTGRHFPDLRNP